MQVDPGRIVVFLPNWVGDAVMFTPTLRALRSRFQGAGMVLVGRAAPVAALTPNPWAAEAIACYLARRLETLTSEELETYAHGDYREFSRILRNRENEIK